jgi:hypothetical protein
MLASVRSPSSITIDAAGQFPSPSRRSNSVRTAVLRKIRISCRLGIVMNAQTSRKCLPG